MPSWGEILEEIQHNAASNGGMVDIDGIRVRYLNKLQSLTGRNVVVYATDWMEPKGPPQMGSIALQDVQGLMEVFRGLDPALGLDLILHSPGGDPNAAASIVQYMRNKFDDVRVVVPLAAMSAATMWALSADSILMGKHSQLGPIDPQLPNPQGYMVPAASILRQFATAQKECAVDPSKLSRGCRRYSNTSPDCSRCAGTRRPSPKLWYVRGSRITCSRTSPTRRNLLTKQRPSLPIPNYIFLTAAELLANRSALSFQTS